MLFELLEGLDNMDLQHSEIQMLGICAADQHFREHPVT